MLSRWTARWIILTGRLSRRRHQCRPDLRWGGWRRQSLVGTATLIKVSAILPTLKIDTDRLLAKHFTVYQVNWIQAEDPLHAAHKQVFALAEKSIRIGWTFCDSFKNVRKRLRFKKRDYLFMTKDWPSALEFILPGDDARCD